MIFFLDIFHYLSSSQHICAQMKNHQSSIYIPFDLNVANLGFLRNQLKLFSSQTKNILMSTWYWKSLCLFLELASVSSTDSSNVESQKTCRILHPKGRSVEEFMFLFGRRARYIIAIVRQKIVSREKKMPGRSVICQVIFGRKWIWLQQQLFPAGKKAEIRFNLELEVHSRRF